MIISSMNGMGHHGSISYLRWLGLLLPYHVKEALVHSGAALDARVNIRWVESESLENGDGRE